MTNFDFESKIMTYNTKISTIFELQNQKIRPWIQNFDLQPKTKWQILTFKTKISI